MTKYFFLKIQNILFYLKVLLLVSFFILSYHGITARISNIGLSPGLLVFIFVWILSILSILILAYNRNNVIKLVWILVITILTILGRTYYDITATYLGFFDFERILDAYAYTDQAISFYTNNLLNVIAITLLLTVGMLIPPYYKNINIKSKTVFFLPFLPILITSGIVYSKSGEGSNGLPDYNNILAYSFIYTIENITTPDNILRAPVNISVKQDKIENIILVMDESIHGAFLDLNNKKNGIITNLPKEHMVNFGLATSASNCSTASNLSVRFGASKNNHLQDILTHPSLWAYAKNAYYTTTYIDGQRTNGHLMNQMTTEELSNVDNFLQLDEQTKPYNKDIIIAQLVRKVLKENKSNFIYINKMGAHFPYEGKYPRSKTLYKPTMIQTYFGNESDPKVNKARTNTREKKLRVINSYKNAVSWNTRQFFKVLLEKLDLKNTAIIYTSDHGQDFNEEDKSGNRTHCSTYNAPADEGIVPFVFITNNDVLLPKLEAARKINFNNVSHFNLYPTILELFGYSAVDIARSGHMEPSIFMKLPNGNREFMSLFFTRFGRKPLWVQID